MPSAADPSLAPHTAATAAGLKDRVASVLELIRPAVRADGGDIELVDVDPQGGVKIRFKGACVGCPSSGMTLTMGIERNLRNQIPEVTSVVAVH